MRPDSPDALLGYLGEVDDRTSRFLETLTAADLDRVVDRRWDRPVTLGVRLVSIADDGLQHVGQAAYVRGLLQGERPERGRRRQDGPDPCRRAQPWRGACHRTNSS